MSSHIKKVLCAGIIPSEVFIRSYLYANLVYILIFIFSICHIVSSKEPVWESYFSYNAISTLYSSNTHLWIGTEDAGIVAISQQAKSKEEYKEAIGKKIYAFAESPDSVLWYASDMGICRYINGQWDICKTTQGDVEGPVFDIITDSGGTIWAISKTEGLLKWEDSLFQIVTIAEDLSTVFDLTCGADNTIWLLKDSEILNLNGTQIEKVSFNDNFSSSDPAVACEADIGGIWISFMTYVRYLKNSSEWDTYYKDSSDFHHQVRSIYSDPKSNELLFYGYGGVSKYVDGKFIAINEQDFTSANVRSVLSDGENRYWIGGKGFLVKSDSGVLEDQTLKELENNDIRYIFVDSQNRVWIKCADASKGLALFKGGGWSYLRESLIGTDDRQVLENRSGNFWVATKFGAVYYTGNIFTTQKFSMQNGLPFEDLTTVLIDSNQTVWLGGIGGVLQRDGSSWIHHEEADSNITGSAIDSSGNIWFTSVNGVSLLSGGVWKKYEAGKELPASRVNSIAISKTNEIWLGTGGSGVVRYSNGEWTVFDQNNGLCNNFVNDIVIDTNNRVWCATNEGLACYNDSTWISFTEATGLQDNWVRSIELDSAQNIWAGTASGLIKLIPGNSTAQIIFMDQYHNKIKPVVHINKSTIFISAIPADPKCLLTIYNLKGQNVFTINLWNLAQRGQGVAVTPHLLPGNYLYCVGSKSLVYVKGKFINY